MPVQWTLSNERLLFLRVLDAYKGPMNYKWLAETWPNPEERPTPRAISEHIFKLKKLAKAEGNYDAAAAAGIADAASPATTPKTPRAKRAPRSGTATASGTGKGKRKRDALKESTPERNFTPVNASRIIKTEQDENVALAELQDQTPSKRARKATEHFNMAVYEANATDDDDDDDQQRYSSVDPEYAPDEASFIDYEGNADKYELPEAY